MSIFKVKGLLLERTMSNTYLFRQFNYYRKSKDKVKKNAFYFTNVKSLKPDSMWSLSELDIKQSIFL